MQRAREKIFNRHVVLLGYIAVIVTILLVLRVVIGR